MTRKEFLKATSLAAAAGAVGSTLPVASGSAGDGAARQQGAGPANGGAPGESKRFPAGITAAVAAFIERTAFDQIPEGAIAAAKHCLIDGFGVILAGSTTHGSAIVRE